MDELTNRETLPCATFENPPETPSGPIVGHQIAKSPNLQIPQSPKSPNHQITK
jgi:hypothetical protein